MIYQAMFFYTLNIYTNIYFFYNDPSNVVSNTLRKRYLHKRGRIFNSLTTFIVQNDIKLQTSLVKLHNHELLQASISSLCSDKSFIMAHNIQYIQQHRSIWNRPISSAVVIVNIGTRAADNDCILSQIFCYFLCYIMINQ